MQQTRDSSWLQSATFEEPSTGSRDHDLSTALTVRLLGANHDGHIELVYPGVRSYDLSAPCSAGGLGDWRYDEFRVSDSGCVPHEIEWARSRITGRWLIQAVDVLHKWTPL